MLKERRQDILQFIRNDGKVVDVGYYLPHGPNGEYVCKVIAEATPEAWDKPEITFITRSYTLAIAWAETWRIK
jgi:hypothetical protein